MTPPVFRASQYRVIQDKSVLLSALDVPYNVFEVRAGARTDSLVPIIAFVATIASTYCVGHVLDDCKANTRTSDYRALIDGS